MCRGWGREGMNGARQESRGKKKKKKKKQKEKKEGFGYGMEAR